MAGYSTRELPAPPSETLLDYRHGNKETSKTVWLRPTLQANTRDKVGKNVAMIRKVNQHERRGVNEVESSKLRTTNNGGRFVLRTISVDRAGTARVTVVAHTSMESRTCIVPAARTRTIISSTHPQNREQVQVQVSRINENNEMHPLKL